ncbi:hypothetical protein DFH07DRAFT_1061773 [Mycena maculata]|uniref:Uncharacterized protein n=1 Tax=Mycena maculata TaxID=230809 RepID=A0AAD7NAR9_9AGAR|nr:hypothetical protein DFH07DRAFT_1061773 [Mycena maculata]
MNSTTTTKTPLGRLALHSTATCSAQATAYGKCILATYTDVTKDVCKEDFAKFAKCLREAKVVTPAWWNASLTVLCHRASQIPNGRDLCVLEVTVLLG